MAKKKMSTKCKVITSVSVILAVVIIATFTISGCMYSLLLRKDTILPRDSVTSMIKDQTGIKPQFMGVTPESIKWYDENGDYERMQSDDGLMLEAKFFENENAGHRYVVICHGYMGRGRQMVSYTQKFLELGFNVLTTDARAHGNSDGDVVGMGYYEKRDLIKWINEFILKRDENAEIVLMGVSMGGATVLLTSGEEDLPSNVKAIVSDCAYTTAYDEFVSQMKDVAHLPAYPFVPIASWISQLRGTYNFKDVDVTAAVAKSHTPTIFIHGTKDDFVPFWMLDELYNAAACPKKKLAVEGALHANSASKNPDLYWSSVLDFVSNYIDMK